MILLLWIRETLEKSMHEKNLSIKQGKEIQAKLSNFNSLNVHEIIDEKKKMLK
jgi:hypothetical protein